jgi:hypothetical protein
METTKMIRKRIITPIHEFAEFIFNREGDCTIFEKIKDDLFCSFLRSLKIKLSNNFKRAIFLQEKRLLLEASLCAYFKVRATLNN